MALNSLDRLLTTLDVQLHAFAVCEVAEDTRLKFAAMDVVVVHYAIRGRGWIEVEGSPPLEIAAGTIAIVPPGQAQALVTGAGPIKDVEAEAHCAMLVGGLIKFDAADGDEGDLQTICSTFSASYGGSFGLFDSLPAPIVENATDIPEIRSAFEILAAERSTPEIGTHALTGALMKQCLILLIRRYLHKGSLATPFFASLADPRLTGAVAQVLEQPGAPLSVATLADTAGMSRTAFTRAFSDAFGQSPMEFVQRARLHRAAQLLVSTGLPVKVIAASVAFASRSHFSRAFKQAYECDPTSYRERHDRSAVGAPASGGRTWFDKLSE